MRSFVVFGCVAGGGVGVAGGRVKLACCFSCAISSINYKYYSLLMTFIIETAIFSGNRLCLL